VSAMKTLTVKGSELEPYIEDLAQLRMSVFRDWPYLYEGTRDYEIAYLQTYLACPDSFTLLVIDNRQVVGATTAIPGSAADQAFSQPLIDHKIDPNSALYLGESLLLSRYRGQGLGRLFFEARQSHAREHGLKTTYFCSVIRRADHPKRPTDYRELSSFWTSLGYSPLEGAIVTFKWRDVGQAGESAKGLQIWTKTEPFCETSFN
jgi:GNAT superfamily N-acetyltransferase